MLNPNPVTRIKTIDIGHHPWMAQPVASGFTSQAYSMPVSVMSPIANDEQVLYEAFQFTAYFYQCLNVAQVGIVS